MQMAWDKKYEVGNERIDFEHHIFLDLVTSFSDKIAQGASKEQMLRLLKEIGKYADFHFTSEENMMIDSSYPDMDRHAELHALLIADLHDITGRFSSEHLAAKEVFDFLFQWFALHTSQEDKLLALHINSR